MISFLRGTLFQIEEESLWLDVNGVGYEIFVPQQMISGLPAINEKLFIYTYLIVQDKDIRLFGFLKKEELNLFKILLGVSGIGAKVAQGIIGAMLPSDFYQAIISGDEKKLQLIPGIGKKTSSRLVFELKERMLKIKPEIQTLSSDNDDLPFVVEALEQLGYSRSEVYPYLLKLKEQGKLSDKIENNIKLVLQGLGK
jgi:Holliday junction DNA helicase RuvA